MANDPQDATHGIYKVPRKFDIATMMVVTLSYAAMVAVFRTLEFPVGVQATFLACKGRWSASKQGLRSSLASCHGSKDGKFHSKKLGSTGGEDERVHSDGTATPNE